MLLLDGMRLGGAPRQWRMVDLSREATRLSRYPRGEVKADLTWDSLFWSHKAGKVPWTLSIGKLILPAVTQLTQSLIPRQLSQRQVRFHVNWVNAEWDSTSTESTRNDKIFVNVGVFCVDSADVESHSALTQLTKSLTPRWLSVREMNQSKTGTHKQLWRLQRDSIYKN